jgi:hypothetical protein
VLYVTGQSGVSPRHRALLGLRTAWLTRSAYLSGHRVPPSRATGLTDDEIPRIACGPDAAGWDPFDAADDDRRAVRLAVAPRRYTIYIDR